MFYRESSGKINAKDVDLFQNESVHKFYHSKALITFEHMNIFSGQKKNLNEQTSMVRVGCF